jgi:hypothetical protein
MAGYSLRSSSLERWSGSPSWERWNGFDSHARNYRC